MQVMEAILSTGKSSRLYQRLVERDQSVTTAGANFHDHIDPSLFYIKAELKPGFELRAVEHAIDDEIERLKDDDDARTPNWKKRSGRSKPTSCSATKSLCNRQSCSASTKPSPSMNDIT